MRKIKYRAWDKVHKHMLKVRGMTFDDQGNIKKLTVSMVQCPECSMTFTKIDDFILMQYTGFKDSNGKEIYEGDILQNGNAGKPVYVKWDDILGAWTINMEDENWSKPISYFNTELKISILFHIIGNIYENPELLEVEDGD